MVMIKLQIVGITETVVSEYAGNTNRSTQIRTRVDAVARSLILHSVDSKIRPQIRGIPQHFKRGCYYL